jgi:ribosomal protein S27E
MYRQSARRRTLDERERVAANQRRWHEPRVWQIKCPACGHDGTVFMPLKQLRQSSFKCSVCKGDGLAE